MPGRLVFTLVAVSLLGSGCALVHDATSMMVHEMHGSVADIREMHRDRGWAEAAWERTRVTCPPSQASSNDYADGFQEGFAHFVFRGGNGEPPPLAPRRYRNLDRQTPCGFAAMEDWFAGFRHGATVARDGGFRRWVTGPSSLNSLGSVVPAGAGESIEWASAIAPIQMVPAPSPSAAALPSAPPNPPQAAAKQPLLPENIKVIHLYVRPEDNAARTAGP